MVGQKAMTFVPSAKRLIGQDAPRPGQGDRCRRPRRRQRRADVRRAAHPRPRHRPGLLRPVQPQLPAGATQAEAVEALRQQGEDKLADMLAAMDHIVPGQGVDFAAVGDVLLLVLAVYAAASVLGWLQGMVLNRVVQNTVYRMRQDVEDKINRLPLNYFDRSPRGELLSRVTNDIDNVSQTLQQTMSQLMTSLLTVVAVLGDDVLDLAAARPGGARLGAAVAAGDPGDHEALAGPVRRPVAAYRPAQRPDRGGLLRPRAGQGVRSPGTRSRRPSPRRTTSSTGSASARSSSPG